MNGFNPEQLVARGVFDSLEELDRVMCELDDVLAAPRVSRVGWSRGMDFNRARVGSGAVMAHDPASEPMRVPPAPNPVAVWGRQPGQPAALCIFCAWERAMQPGPRMARPQFNGDVMLWPCARHADRPQNANPQPAVSREHHAGIYRPAA
jgi:hypothetical protein